MLLLKGRCATTCLCWFNIYAWNFFCIVCLLHFLFVGAIISQFPCFIVQSSLMSIECIPIIIIEISFGWYDDMDILVFGVMYTGKLDHQEGLQILPCRVMMILWASGVGWETLLLSKDVRRTGNHISLRSTALLFYCSTAVSTVQRWHCPRN